MKFTSELFDVYISPARTPTDRRVDVVVGVRVSKKAVVRNRLRRQLKEILRLYLQTGNSSGYYLRVAAKPPLINQKFSQIKKQIEAVLDKIK
ncbi:MAG: ribonuclease P protein component [Minisyncoccia bacterium]